MAIRTPVTLRLRRATEADSTLLWEWRNDPVVRRAAFSSNAIAWQTHADWFCARIHSDRCVMYIVESADGIPIGQVRFDVDPGVAAEVDLSVAAEWRSKGLAAQVLRLACEAYHDGAPEVLVAHIRPENRPSVRAFERTGFRHAGRERVGGHEALRLELRPDTSSAG